MKVRRAGQTIRVMDSKDLRDQITSNLTGREALALAERLNVLAINLKIAGQQARTQEILSQSVMEAV